MPQVNGGFLLIARRAISPESWLWKLPGDYIKVFLWLVWRARWKSGTDDWFDGSALVKIERGEMVTSVESIAVANRVPRSKVRRILEMFKKSGTISANAPTKRWTRITINNFNTYQNLDNYLGQQSDKDPAQDRPETGLRAATEGRQGKQGKEGEDTKSPRSRKALADADPPGFQDFWQAYPRKVGKGAARRAWAKLNGRHEQILPAALAALAWQVASQAWTKEGGAFIPHPATYLNQERWTDEKPSEVNPGIPDSTRRRLSGIASWVARKEAERDRQ